MDNEEVDHGPKCSACRIRQQDEALRELFTFSRSAARGCRSLPTDLTARGASIAYDDVADRLEKILDGES